MALVFMFRSVMVSGGKKRPSSELWRRLSEEVDELLGSYPYYKRYIVIVGYAHGGV
jgi:hypothetical protein